MPRTAKPADIAKVVKAIKAVMKAWRTANALAQIKVGCNAKPGKAVIDTVMACRDGYRNVESGLRSLEESIVALAKAYKQRLPPKHPMYQVADVVNLGASTRWRSLVKIQNALLAKQQKFIKQLEHIKHK